MSFDVNENVYVAPSDSQNLVLDNSDVIQYSVEINDENSEVHNTTKHEGMDCKSEQAIVYNSRKASELETGPNYQKQDVDFQSLDCLKETDETKLFETLNELPEEVLISLLNEVNEIIAGLKKENDIYEFMLQEDKSVLNALEMIEMDEQSRTSEDRMTLLSYSAKCYFAVKRLKQLEKNFEQETSTCSRDTQDLQFQLESLNLSLEALKEVSENFNKNVRIGGRHPVTKKVILQKVTKFFDDSIKNKMAMINRCKIQIQSDIMERNKLLSQIKEQEKRLASLDFLKYQEAKFEHEKSCKSLLLYKNQLAKCKSKYSSISQSVVAIKKSLDKEKHNMEQIQAALSKKEYMKNVMVSEKARNEQKVKELNAAMRKIKLDPRRHNLPEVAEYAIVKRENEVLKRNIKQWKQKVSVAEQAQLMHLSALQKKS